MKKFLSLLLALTLTLCFSNAVFAAEDTGNPIPENATRHTIELTLEPGENIIPIVGEGSENGIAPYIWGDPSMSLVDNHVAYTSPFYVSDKYFGYEMQAVTTSGAAINEVYAVGLEYVGGAIIASMSGYADGSIYKKDWITINVDGNYRFKVSNGTNSDLTVSMVYYSWN